MYCLSMKRPTVQGSIYFAAPVGGNTRSSVEYNSGFLFVLFDTLYVQYIQSILWLLLIIFYYTVQEDGRKYAIKEFTWFFRDFVVIIIIFVFVASYVTSTGVLKRRSHKGRCRTRPQPIPQNTCASILI